MKQSFSAATLGAGLVGLSALGYAFNPIFGKVAYAAGANAISLGAVRFLIAATLMWTIIPFRPRAAVTAGQRARLIGMGIFGLAVVALLYFTALDYMGASLATGIFYTYPAMVTLAGVIRGQGISPKAIVGLLLTTAGTWILLSNDLNGFSWFGALLIFLAAAWYTTFILVSARWTRDLDPVVVSAYVSGGAAVVYLAAAVLTGQTFPAAQAIWAGAGLALLSTVLAMITFFAGLVRVGSVQASIISTLEPVFTTLLAVLILGEHLSLLQSVGIGLVMVGAVAAQFKDKITLAAD